MNQKQIVNLGWSEMMKITLLMSTLLSISSVCYGSNSEVYKAFGESEQRTFPIGLKAKTVSRAKEKLRLQCLAAHPSPITFCEKLEFELRRSLWPRWKLSLRDG